MALEVLRGPDNAPLDPLMGKTVAVIGFGNQGHAHALNLRDSGLRVVIANRADSPNGRNATLLGFEPLPVEQAVQQADLTIIALPDESQPEVYERRIAPCVRPGSTVGFIHGFAIRYDRIKPAAGLGAVMVAPKGPGTTLRERFVQGQGIPCLLAIHQDSATGDADALALAWANGIGCARAGIIRTTFEHETDTDLFGEQAVLCGGMTQLILAAFDTLMAAGYPAELAYLECCHEVKQIADLVYARGLAAMMEAISNTAEFGAYAAGPVLIDAEVRARMRKLLEEIQNGAFARRMRDDYAGGFAWFKQQRELLRKHPIEPAGKSVRALMPWLSEQQPSKPV